MAGKRSPKLPRQPRQVQKMTGSAGRTKGDQASRGKNAKPQQASQHRVKPGQQAPVSPTSGSGAPYPQTSRTRTTVPLRDARSGVRDQAGKLFGNADARNQKLSKRSSRQT